MNTYTVVTASGHVCEVPFPLKPQSIVGWLAYERPQDIRANEPTIRAIQEAVCEAYGLTLQAMLGERRSVTIARPRQIAMYMAANLTNRSYPTIGRAFDRDRTTVMHGVSIIHGLLLRDSEMAAKIAEITANLA